MAEGKSLIRLVVQRMDASRLSFNWRILISRRTHFTPSLRSYRFISYGIDLTLMGAQLGPGVDILHLSDGNDRLLRRPVFKQTRSSRST